MGKVQNLRKALKTRTRVGVIWSLLAPLILIGISNPQIAFAAPSVSLPATLTAGNSFTNVNSAGALSISGYNVGASIQVTVSATSGNLKIVTTTGLTAPTGYTSAAWTSGTATEIAFYGSQTDVSNALNSLQYKASAVDAPATITVTSFVAGAAYNSTTGHFYEIVENGSVITWELSRCKALYSNSDVSVSAGDSLQNNNRCTSSTALTRRTLGGLQGYLATITTQAEHEFIFGKLTGTGWIGGADTDSEGTFIWMDGPEKGQPFWNSSSTTRGGTNLISGLNRYNYFNTGEPNNAGAGEDFAEFGFGANGSWNDCQNGCNRTRYVIEYGEDGDVLSGASGTINVNPRNPVTTETDTALSLSGSQFLSSAQEAPFDIPTGTTFTLEAWVRPSVTNASQILLGKNNQYALLINSNGSFGMNFYTTNVPAGCGGDSGIFGANSARANEWQHVAVVRSGSTVTGYLNGQPVGTLSGCSATDSIKTGSNSFVVGGYSTTDQPFTGQIDQVRAWSSARTAAELQSGMSVFIPSPQTNLIAAYGFNENTGAKVFNNASSAIWETDLNLNGGSSSWSQIAETSTVDAYSVVTFRRSYLTSAGGWRVPSGISRIQTLLVAGGGGGGGGLNGGGGGAGGFIETITSVSSASPYSIIVGAGGIGWSSTQHIVPTNGTNSSAFSLTAVGGGYGGVEDYYSVGIHYPPNSGGSGGGGSWGQTASYRSGASGTTGQGNAGGSNLNYCCTAAGGGGAGGVGVNTSSTKAGDGGPGRTSVITGTILGGGGGGASRNAGVSLIGTGGTGGGGSAGSTNGGNGNNGTANTGGGGGGTWASPETSGRAGNGGSGIIVIRWITASAPIYTPPVAVDTTTAGTRYKFQVSGTSNSPLIRNYTWQFSSDTGTSWTTLQASTADSYTTTTLETTTSGSRYSYRVIVTDSDTAGLSISESSTFTLVINPRITITGSSVSLSQKYGETQTVTYTIANGTGTRTTVASPNNRTGITWSSVSGDSATIGIGPGLGFGTYYETLTVTDSVTAITTLMITISISKADTITVTVNSPSALNYTGNTASFTPSVSFSGLKHSDAATASSVTITQTRAGNTCAMGGTCAIGDRGPGGGIVFITPSTPSGNGKYFEAAPDAWYGTNDLSSVGKFCTSALNRDNTNEGATQYGIGWGETNTAIFKANCTGGAVKLATDYRGGGFSDWFVPNKNELAEMAKIPTTVDLNNVSGYWGYWSSTEDGSGPASTMSSLTSSSWTMGTVSKSDSTHNMVRPVRMFTPCNAVDSCTAFASTTMPTNAGTYRLTPSALTLSSGDLANYQGVTYASGLLTINKVSQTPIKIGQYDAFPGVSTYPLNVYGGSGTGVMRRTLTSSGTASCVLTNIMFLTASTPGKCDVRVTKAADFNYLAEAATATIYWIQFQTNYLNGAAGGATGITLTGETAIERRTYETFTVLSFADETGTAVTSIRANTKLRVIGTGFVAADGTTEVYFGMASVPHSGLTFNTLDPMANYVLLTVPADAETDRVLMYSDKGWATSPGALTILP